jgi:Domain of unknown function (DUF397)/Domain of unknown function (DUF5753)
MQRQRRLAARDAPSWFIVDELSLYRRVGARETMTAQMRHLLAVAARLDVTLPVLPAVAHPATGRVDGTPEKEGRGMDWRKSSHSGANGGSCVEVTGTARVVLVRDTTDRDGQTLGVHRRGVARVRRGTEALTSA